mgnify:CR=1 FL=1
MAEELTKEQEEKIKEYRQRYFKQATSTDPAGREKAEEAAKKLAEIGGVKVSEAIWVPSPEDGARTYNSDWDSLSDSLSDSLRDSLSDSLSDSLRHSLRDSLRYSLRDSLRYSLRDSLRVSLRVLIRVLIRVSIRDSLMDSLWASLRDMDELASIDYSVNVLEVELSSNNQKLLSLYKAISESCFAVWILPGRVILCDRPKEVEIKDGRLVGLTWRG